MSLYIRRFVSFRFSCSLLFGPDRLKSQNRTACRLHIVVAPDPGSGFLIKARWQNVNQDHFGTARAPLPAHPGTDQKRLEPWIASNASYARVAGEGAKVITEKST